MFQLWCSVIGVSGLDVSELFLQPRAQLQLSTSNCVPHLDRASGMCSFLPCFLTSDSGINGAWVLKAAVWSEASMFSEETAARCQPQLSTSISP